MKKFLSDDNVAKILNVVGENIFILDKELNIIWVNDYSKSIISELEQYIPIKNPSGLVGKNLNEIVPPVDFKERRLFFTEDGPFPYSSKMNLFNKFTADIYVDKLVVDSDLKGFVITWKDVTFYEEVVKVGQQIIRELSSPVIETSIKGAILIPVIGTLTDERIQLSIPKILEECHARHSEFVIFDFTGVTSEISSYVSLEFEKLRLSLELMGVQVIYAGIPAIVVKQFIRNQTSFGRTKHFINYNQAMNYVLDQKGYEIVEKKS